MTCEITQVFEPYGRSDMSVTPSMRTRAPGSLVVGMSQMLHANHRDCLYIAVAAVGVLLAL